MESDSSSGSETECVPKKILAYKFEPGNYAMLLRDVGEKPIDLVQLPNEPGQYRINNYRSVPVKVRVDPKSKSTIIPGELREMSLLPNRHIHFTYSQKDSNWIVVRHEDVMSLS